MEVVDRLSVHLLNVGRGDSILIDFPDGSFGLIDSGPKAKGEAVVEYIEDRLRRHCVFRFLALTHWDADHAAGIPLVLEQFKPERFYRPEINLPLLEKLAANGGQTSPVTLAERIRAARHPDTNECPLFARQVLQTPAGIDLIALSPDSQVADELHEKVRQGITSSQLREFRNRLSAVLWLRYAGVKLFLTGEVEEKQYEWMSRLFRSRYDPLGEQYGTPQAHWIKLSHHGAEGNNPPFLFQHFAAQGFVASASAGGANGHPHPEVLYELHRQGGKAMCTRLGQACGYIQKTGLERNPSSWPSQMRPRALPNPKQNCYGIVSVDISRDESGNGMCRISGDTTQLHCPYGGPPEGEVRMIVR